jgi:peptidyl-prolyl cis-trans isomerase SurA
MKKNIFFILFITIANMAFIASALAQNLDRALDKVVVVVNNSVITQHEIDRAVLATKKQFAATNMPLPPEKKLRTEIINSLIDQELQRQLVKLSNITTSETEVDDAITDIAKRNNLTSTQLRHELIKSGGNFAQYRDRIREQIAFARVQHQGVVDGNIAVSDQEVEKFLMQYKKVEKSEKKSSVAEYHLQTILIPLSDNPSPDDVENAKQQAGNLLHKIKGGESFDTVATSGYNDLGWRKLADITPIFAKIVKDMRPGNVSSVLVRAPNGFHILKLAEVRDADNNTANIGQKIDFSNKNKIRALIFQHKYEEKVRLWLQKLRDSAYIKFM